jgi:hypothetical protein
MSKLESMAYKERRKLKIAESYGVQHAIKTSSQVAIQSIQDLFSTIFPRYLFFLSQDCTFKVTNPLGSKRSERLNSD